MIQTNVTDKYTEIYVNGGGNFITQSAPTNFHTFFTSKMLTKNESIDDFKEVTAKEKESLEAADAAWERPPQSFIDLFCGTYDDYNLGGAEFYVGYNPATGYFYIKFNFSNVWLGLDDISYKEAIRIYNRLCSTPNYPYNTAKIRINLPPYAYPNPTLGTSVLHYHSDMEYLLLCRSWIGYTGVSGVIQRCPKLKGIIGMINLASSVTYPKLEKLQWLIVLFNGSNRTFSLPDSPLLEYESLNQTILKLPGGQSGNKYIVHPDVYAKLSGDYSNPAAAALTDEERSKWVALVPAAIEKGFTFATA